MMSSKDSSINFRQKSRSSCKYAHRKSMESSNQHYYHTSDFKDICPRKQEIRNSIQNIMTNTQVSTSQRTSQQNLSSIFRDSISKRLEAFKEMLYRQGAAILGLERKLQENEQLIERQRESIQTLKSYLEQLVTKNESDNHSQLVNRRIQDLEKRISLVLSQCEKQKKTGQKFQSQTADTFSKVSNLVNNILFGRIMGMKSLLLQFVKNSLQRMTSVEDQLVQALSRESVYESLKAQIRQIGSEVDDLLEERDNPVSILRVNSSREQVSLNSFHYPETDYCVSVDSNEDPMSSLRQIIESREGIMKCYINREGHLKYYDSGTYVFDRKGNTIRMTREQALDLGYKFQLLDLDL